MTISTPMRSILAQGATEQAASTPTPSPRGIHLANLQTIMGSNSGRIISLTRLGRGRLNSLVWSRDGKTLAVASSVGVWVYASGHWDDEPAFLEGLDSDVSSIAFSPDGKLLVSGSNDPGVQLWELQKG